MSETEAQELIAECERRMADGLDLVPIVVRRAKEPRSRRVRVMPGLMGEVSCWNEDGRLVVYVACARLRSILYARQSGSPRAVKEE